MTKKELKKYLRLLPKLVSAIETHKPWTYIQISRKRQKVVIHSWLNNVLKYLIALYDNSDWVTKKIINDSYFNNTDDRNIFSTLPISEATYYRIKQQIVNKIFSLLILEGFVSYEEILKDD